jgi:hypothetical protein
MLIAPVVSELWFLVGLFFLATQEHHHLVLVCKWCTTASDSRLGFSLADISTIINVRGSNRY